MHEQGDRSPLDVLRVDPDGAAAPTYSCCLAGCGFFGDVQHSSEQMRWAGPARYDIAGAGAPAVAAGRDKAPWRTLVRSGILCRGSADAVSRSAGFWTFLKHGSHSVRVQYLPAEVNNKDSRRYTLSPS